MDPVYIALFVLVFLIGVSFGVYGTAVWWKADAREVAVAREAREKFILQIGASERELILKQLAEARAEAWGERRELYSRIQAYDPNVGDYTPPSITRPPSRPGEEVTAERSYTDEELGQMGLVQQADGMIRDTRSDALFETVEDWRFWQEDLRRRNLPVNVHPTAVQELGWEQAATLAKQQTAAAKKLAKN